jgi:hypothetical protein
MNIGADGHIHRHGDPCAGIGMAIPRLGPFLLSVALLGCKEGSINTVAVSPDGTIAFGVSATTGYSFFSRLQRNQVAVTDSSGASLGLVSDGLRHSSWVSFSPDGRYLLCIESQPDENGKPPLKRESTLVTYDISSAKRTIIRADEDINAYCAFPAFSPSGTYVAYMTSSFLRIVKVRDGEEVISWPRASDESRLPGVAGYSWISDTEVFILWAVDKVGDVGANGGDVFLVRLGTVEVSDDNAVPSTAEFQDAPTGMTWVFPSISSVSGKTVLSLFDLAVPASDDEITASPLSLWLFSSGSLRRLTVDSARYYYTALAPDGQRVAAIRTPITENSDSVFVPGPGALVLVDANSGEARTVVASNCLHPFWIDNNRLGYVRVQEDWEANNRIVVLDLADDSQEDIAESLPERLAMAPRIGHVSQETKLGAKVRADERGPDTVSPEEEEHTVPYADMMMAASVLLVIGGLLYLWLRHVGYSRDVNRKNVPQD